MEANRSSGCGGSWVRVDLSVPHPWMKLVGLWKVLQTSHESTGLPESGTEEFYGYRRFKSFVRRYPYNLQKV